MKSSPCKFCDSTLHQSFQCFYRVYPDTKPCKHCGGTDHLSWRCYQNPKRVEESKRKFKRGKQQIKWIKTRKKWLRTHKADYYTCYLCGKSVPRLELTLDHIKNRSSHPSLSYDFDNLAPCCWDCNIAKGSQSLENYLASRDK